MYCQVSLHKVQQVQTPSVPNTNECTESGKITRSKMHSTMGSYYVHMWTLGQTASLQLQLIWTVNHFWGARHRILNLQSHLQHLPPSKPRSQQELRASYSATCWWSSNTSRLLRMGADRVAILVTQMVDGSLVQGGPWNLLPGSLLVIRQLEGV